MASSVFITSGLFSYSNGTVSINNGAMTLTSAGRLTTLENILSGGDVRVPTGSAHYWASSTELLAPANGLLNIRDSAAAFGLQLNTGTAAPTCSNGTITAGSRNTTGQITLTGGNTGSVLTFGSPAWTNAPFVTIGACIGAAGATEPVVTTTQVTFAGHVANSIITYHAIARI